MEVVLRLNVIPSCCSCSTCQYNHFGSTTTTIKTHCSPTVQLPTSPPKTKYTQTTRKSKNMVYTPKQNFALLLASKHSKSTIRTTKRHHRANQGKTDVKAE